MAITQDGKIYAVGSDGNVKTVKPSEFDHSKYQALTYKDLLSIREKSPSSAFNVDTLMDMHNAIGMSSIMKAISDIVKSFGTIQQSGYTTKGDKDIAEGLAQLIGDGPNGVYKITDKHRFGSSGEDELLKAIKFVANALPSNYKKALNAISAVEGIDPVELVSQIIQITANKSVEPSYQSMASKSAGYGPGGSKSSGGLSGSKTMTPAESYATGEGAGPTEWKLIVPDGASVSLMAATRSMGNVRQKDTKQPMGKVSLQYLLENAHGISEQNLDGAITFGDQLLTDAQKNAIMYDGLTMRRVILPSKMVNGKIVPDFEIAERIEKLTSDIREYIDAMTPGQLQDIISERLPGAK